MYKVNGNALPIIEWDLLAIGKGVPIFGTWRTNFGILGKSKHKLGQPIFGTMCKVNCNALPIIEIDLLSIGKGIPIFGKWKTNLGYVEQVYSRLLIPFGT